MITQRELFEQEYISSRRKINSIKDNLRKRSLSQLRNKTIRSIRQSIINKYFNNNIPPELDEPLNSLIKNLIGKSTFYKKESGGWTVAKGKIKNDVLYITDEIVGLLGSIFSNLKYTKKRRPGFNKNNHLSTYLYLYIKNFPQTFKEIAENPLVDVGIDKYNKLIKLCDQGNTAADMLLPYIKKNPLYKFFYTTVPLFPIKQSSRYENQMILAKSGHGKTQLLHHFIYGDLLKARKDKMGFCIIDSQTDLIDTISHLSLFDPKLKNSLAEKLILIDPSDFNYPVSLNLFDINLSRIKDIKNPTEREQAHNFAISLYGYIFSDLIKGELTMYQQNIFKFCGKVLLSMSGANILTFLDLLKNPEKYQAHIENLDDLTLQFFKDEFNSPIYNQTKKQISARLWAIVGNKAFKNMFVNERNKIDMFEAMNDGKIIMINTSKLILQSEGAKILGKFFLAMILQSAFQRAAVQEDKRKAFIVYIDEAQDYMTDTMAEFFSQIRKFRIGAVIAHQYLKQLDDVSVNLKHSVLTNTTIKFIGRLNPSDVRAISDQIMVNSEEIRQLKKKDWAYTEFLCYVDYLTNKGVKIRVPLGKLDGKESMSKESYKLLIEKNRQKYCSPLKDYTEPNETEKARIKKEGVGFIEKTTRGFTLGKKKEL